MAPPGQRALLLGWSGADWRFLDPLLSSGRLPHLAKLLFRGARGSLRTLQPQSTPLLWTSVATGQRADRHGVLQHLFANEQGEIRPLSSLDRKSPALWEIPGLRNLVVNWPATFPTRSLTGICVSDMFFRLAGSAQDLEPADPASCFPREYTESLSTSRFCPGDFHEEEVSFFMEEPQTARDEQDPLQARLLVGLAEAVSTQGVMTRLIDEHEWDLAMVRFDLLETLGPLFMACQSPALPFVNESLARRYSDTMNAACQYLDLMLGVLIDKVGDDCNVILFSERGLHSGSNRPPEQAVLTQTGDTPWYREHGVLVVAGPNIRAQASLQGAGLLDLAPTALQLLGLEPSPGIPGRSLCEVFDILPTTRPVIFTDYLTPTGQLTDEQTSLLFKRWRELELVPGETNLVATAEAIRQQHTFNRAIVALDARRIREAAPLLETLHNQAPENARFAIHLARCRRKLGNLDGARELLESVVDHHDPRPLEQMQLASLHLACGDHDKALACLFRAEQSEGGRPSVHARIGEVYLGMSHWEEASAAFERGLDRDPDHAACLRGAAACLLALGNVELAIEMTLKAIISEHDSAQGHLLLGQALLTKGDGLYALHAFQTSLGLDEDNPRVHEGLHKACLILGDETGAADHLARAQQLRAVASIQQQLHDLRL